MAHAHPLKSWRGRLQRGTVLSARQRIEVMSLLVLFALFVGDGHETRWRIIAFVIFAVAVITDRFDGALARSYDMVTEFGQLADPIADKALIGAALIALVVAKLFFIELGNQGGLARIVSFIGVGVLLLIVGYFAPLPPRRAEPELEQVKV